MPHSTGLIKAGSERSRSQVWKASVAKSQQIQHKKQGRAGEAQQLEERGWLQSTQLQQSNRTAPGPWKIPVKTILGQLRTSKVILATSHVNLVIGAEPAEAMSYLSTLIRKEESKLPRMMHITTFWDPDRNRGLILLVQAYKALSIKADTPLKAATLRKRKEHLQNRSKENKTYETCFKFILFLDKALSIAMQM